MSDMYREAYDRALANGGVITRRDLMSLGFTARMIEGRLRRGQWSIVTRGLYRLAASDNHRDVLKSVLAAWPGAVASHDSAAQLHGFPHVPAERLVVSHHSRTTFRFPGVEVRRTHDLDAWHLTEVDGIRTTTVARTIVDLAADRSAALIGRTVDQLISDGRVELFEVEAVVAAVARRGKPGMKTIRKVLETRSGPDRSGSLLERKGRTLIRDAGLPPPVSEYPIPWTVSRRFDDAYPERKLAIEWDSRRYHGQRAAFEADRARDRDAAVHGWRILRFTWEDVTRYPDRVVDTVRALLAA
ncbi:MAG: DUF559 domain-containing protein [Acidimicrobiia bacterium]